jgi:hypothetical protein
VSTRFYVSKFAEHVLRYLRGHFDKPWKFSRDTILIDALWGWVDSDWTGDTDTRRSHDAYVLMLNCGAVSWKSRCKDSVTLSTSETQYIASCEVGKEIKYLRALLRVVGSTQDHTTNVCEDNLTCIVTYANPVRR